MEVLLNFAMSINGSLGVINQQTLLSNDDDWRRVHALRANHDLIMVGANTIRIDNPSLRVKSEYYPHSNSQPVRVIPSYSGLFHDDYHVFVDPHPTLLLLPESKSSFHPPDSWKNVRVAFLPDLSPKSMIAFLEDAGYSSLFIEGGARLLTSFLNSNVLLKTRIFMSPVVFSRDNSVFWGACSRRLSLISLQRLGDGIEFVFQKE